MNLMKKLLWILLTFCPSAAFAGQHSGLGGGTTPAPPPPETPGPYKPLDQFQQWVSELIETAKTEKTQKPVSK